ncbi:hypothetical protein DU508_22950 [Pedobacter chinensis]|uniref:Uncharacterized protein n=1 Tax=Pedobacter chinensis TaxID=2282421 RepID=A0A369PPI7_9SPHI|nr:hypothetical protein [Pedobacter chinensis]RDC54192.1 hypothetical protein DU508_22950 [Pedobacter chinensis]
MKKLNLLCIAIIFTLVESCKNEQNLSLPDLKEAVQHDKSFILLQESSNSLINLTLEGKINVSKADKELINKQVKQAKSLDDLKTIMKNAKVVGAEEFATLLYNQNQSIKSLMFDYPQLKTLPKEDLKNILNIRVKSQNSSINSSISRILNKK